CTKSNTSGITADASNPSLLTILTSNPVTAEANTSFKVKPCANIPKRAASIEENIITGNVGYFLIAPNRTIAGGNNNNIFQLNIVLKVSSIAFIVSGAETSSLEMFKPTIKYTVIATIAAGTVVHIICLICS